MYDGLFTAFRHAGNRPTNHGEHRTAATIDVRSSLLVFACCIILLASLLTSPATRGHKRWFAIGRNVFAIFIGSFILLVNFGHGWETSMVHTKVQYKAGTSQELDVNVGVYIGLRGVNITMQGREPEETRETVNFNEQFLWSPSWEQGQQFYGPHAGQINQEFGEAQYRGVPYPILWVAEYFTVDGEDIRWGRSYRRAGYVVYALLWFSFSTWVLANVLLLLVIELASYCAIITGLALLLANFLYWLLRWGPSLQIPLGDTVLVFSFGWCYWATMVMGILCSVVGVTLLVYNYYWPENTVKFLHDCGRPKQNCAVNKDEEATPDTILASRSILHHVRKRRISISSESRKNFSKSLTTKTKTLSTEDENKNIDKSHGTITTDIELTSVLPKDRPPLTDPDTVEYFI